jgi:V/A-type H+-transporting ATPase subunit A
MTAAGLTGTGTVVRAVGPVVEAEGLAGVRINEVVRVGPAALAGEVVRLEGERAVLQVYEDTSGLQVGDTVARTGAALEVELGPGLLGSIYDGIQRPLPALATRGADPFGRPFLARGATAPALDRTLTWPFQPAVRTGQAVGPGDLLGTVPERGLVHRVLVPPGLEGTVTAVRAEAVRVDEPVAWVDGRPVPMLQRWPVRRPRPFRHRLELDHPLVTGQRVIDTLFPLARGGTAAIPGGFGTGKTVQEQALAKWADADVVVYVGCGERGNELTEILEEFPRLADPRTGASLLDRTILIANTSNMPVAAREASVYTGVTLAEYYRDQGYHVALMADSTSRWGEALREVCARLEEMPGEEGYPAYLAARLAEFYERAGAVACLGADGRQGSVTIIGAVSPPGADFSEPVTQHSLRVSGTFWALDTDLARRRHFPAIHWARSYTLYELGSWFDREVSPRWEANRRWAMALLQQEGELQDIVQLVGPDALGPAERLVLDTGRRLREGFLQQSAFDPVDACCPLDKQRWMLATIRHAHEAAADALTRGADLRRLAELPALVEVMRMRTWPPERAAEVAGVLCRRLDEEIQALTDRDGGGGVP